MCGLFASQDPSSYAAETRPVRLSGHATSIRLEAAFWDILEEIARAEGLSVAGFATVLHDEIVQHHGQIANFASILRVTCLHYRSRRQAHAREIAGLDGAGLQSEPEIA